MTIPFRWPIADVSGLPWNMVPTIRYTLFLQSPCGHACCDHETSAFGARSGGLGSSACRAWIFANSTSRGLMLPSPGALQNVPRSARVDSARAELQKRA